MAETIVIYKDPNHDPKALVIILNTVVLAFMALALVAGFYIVRTFVKSAECDGARKALTEASKNPANGAPNSAEFETALRDCIQKTAVINP